MYILKVYDDNKNKKNEPSIVVQPYRNFSYPNYLRGMVVLQNCKIDRLISENTLSGSSDFGKFFIRFKYLSILIKIAMHYGHILRKDLRAFGKLKFWSLLFFHLIFSLMRLTFYLSTCCILGLSKNNFQFCFKFNFKMNQILVKTHRYTFSR